MPTKIAINEEVAIITPKSPKSPKSQDRMVSKEKNGKY
jgi:hypothetical protein